MAQGSLLFFAAFFLSGILQLACGQVAPGASPVASPPANGGTAVDQGVACVLMIAALLVTYLVH